ncbi:Serine/threonine-protein kinase tousled-like, TSL [Chondrus crispus]|uniref:Serine/threonine-protein kinase tousled-like, TSL n=1 Tax=Chondrus crispus TaxID=2769 RepID=S0F3X5_CHOCR|nr:Serine/threonine-protein kinase tousled-like, TSL [Chondrus crispus]CDF77593.1 Serine/threonine-protein kinase tousled-like, TSL [Chondrus crispus]|eukprot:XP_005718457.1 Serine/threonine-protein kinase tousled-like, TSL [Chondrus crispus]
MSAPSTPLPKGPTHRLALLEARLDGKETTKPPAPLPTEEDDVRSFSSDASQLRVYNPRRRYAPRARSRDSIPNISNKKRKRSSPAAMRNTRVDSFFKPLTPLGEKEQPREAKNPRKSLKEGRVPSDPDVDMTPTRRQLCFAEQDACDENNSESVANESYKYFRAHVDKLTAENDKLRSEHDQAEVLRSENEDLRTQLELEVPDLRDQLAKKTVELESSVARADALAVALRDIVVLLAKAQRREARSKAVNDSERLGKVVVERTRTTLNEVWEDGDEWKQLEADLQRIQLERETLEKKRKEVSKKKALAQKMQTAHSENQGREAEVVTPAKSASRTEMPPPRKPRSRSPTEPFEESLEYVSEQEEIYRVQLQLLRREESTLQDRRVHYLRKRDLIVRELRRQNDERQSPFSNFPVLNDRYVVLNLLGRGGFSEVFKAFDLRRATHVACKIHQLASNWSEEKKRSFIRHAWREYTIHKSLKHPRVVQLVDIFEIDENTFCTVLEYCEGCDLDSYLRSNKTLAEKEARSIIAQVFSGLQYLAEQQRRIIHYDLKPGNILLYKGEVQITDFGLSKIMNETESTTDGMELTSQGAGTMWYLPPECFETGQQARISVKVDVWSAGVILFQMLYGRKPFGHDQSQEKMFREKTVSHQELQFPTRPGVSETAKDFMRKCLTRKASARPDVRQALLHPFFNKR